MLTFLNSNVTKFFGEYHLCMYTIKNIKLIDIFMVNIFEDIWKILK